MPVRLAGLVCPFSQVEGKSAQGLAAEAAAFACFPLLLLSMDFSAKYYARTGRPGGRASRIFYCYFLVWTFPRNTTQGLAVQAMALRALLATTSKYGLFVELIRKLREKSCAME